jgi:hypothetical protein
MSNDILGEYAQAVWKSQRSSLAGMDDVEMRTRARMLRDSFDRTTFVPLIAAAVIGLIFSLALLSSEGILERAGAVIGIFSAAYLFIRARRICSRHHEHESTCLRSYMFQLGQQRDALKACGTTFLLIGVACVLLNAQDGNAWRTIFGAASAASASLLSFMYVRLQVRRYQRRIDELVELERS